ncbi:MAG: N-6 DNA methylase, partial [archaeon]
MLKLRIDDKIADMTDKETAYQKIAELIKRFDEQYDSYKNVAYNETLTRRDFIDPFFKALGWDIDNEQGNAEAYREVIHEDKLKVGGATKAPDYSFRLSGGKRLFFVEAKKPSVFVKDEIQPAYQVRRYGWSAKHPISIITDFEEFSVYDCTKKPSPSDKASVARIKYLTFRDYLKEFDFLWETFSKEQVKKGSFDRFVQSDTHKKGTATVDKEFLQSLDSWRTYLATSISWNNKQLDEDEINFAVQQTIDRIIFLRIAEDRSIEPYGNLKQALKNGDYYANLFELFRKADEKYNSGLFSLRKDRISESLKIDDKVIKTILNELYYPESPYEFSVLSVEILGSAYEQFLGKVIRITPAHHAKIEEKPEVRKAGGVYYTPQYIVEYIVKNTVGKLVEGKTPKEVSNIKIVDPACGSGSFLIGAYQYLLDWHKNFYYETSKSNRGKKDNPLTPEGNLTTAEKKRILLNNIYGVDIDANAVEVTKLSLLLKCLEGETEASIQQQLTIWNERVLPTLDENIKDGNSLIDTDIYDSQLDFGDERKIKPFNWRKEFPDIFNRKTSEKGVDLKTIATKAKQHAKKAMEYASELEEMLSEVDEPQPNYEKNSGGFDVVIGNPPYGASSGKETQKYLSTKYGLLNPISDTFLMFILRAFHISVYSGLVSYIVPSTWLYMPQYRSFRKQVIDQFRLDEVQLFRKPIFCSAV